MTKHLSAFALVVLGSLIIAACTRTGAVVEQPDTTSSVPPAPTNTVVATTSIVETTTIPPAKTTTTASTATTTTTAAAPSTTIASTTTITESSDEPASDEPFLPLDLPIGTCFDDPDPDVELVTPDNVPIVDCSEPHDNEVYENTDIDGIEFPGAAEVQGASDDICFGAFDPYVGAPYESSIYDFSWYFPTAESWELGARNVICFVYNIDLEKITGSVEGTGQ